MQTLAPDGRGGSREAAGGSQAQAARAAAPATLLAALAIAAAVAASGCVVPPEGCGQMRNAGINDYSPFPYRSSSGHQGDHLVSTWTVTRTAACTGQPVSATWAIEHEPRPCGNVTAQGVIVVGAHRELFELSGPQAGGRWTAAASVDLAKASPTQATPYVATLQVLLPRGADLAFDQDCLRTVLERVTMRVGDRAAA